MWSTEVISSGTWACFRGYSSVLYSNKTGLWRPVLSHLSFAPCIVPQEVTGYGGWVQGVVCQANSLETGIYGSQWGWPHRTSTCHGMSQSLKRKADILLATYVYRIDLMKPRYRRSLLTGRMTMPDLLRNFPFHNPPSTMSDLFLFYLIYRD